MDNIYEEIFSETYGYPVCNLNENNSRNIRDSIIKLRSSYRSNEPITEYDKSSIRKAYMLAYYPNYMNLVYELVKLHIVDNLTNEARRIKVVFFAAGPGPEVSGVLKALNDSKFNKRLDINILDLEKGWEKERKVTSNIIKKLDNLKISSLNHLSGCDLTVNCKQICSNWVSCEKSIFQGDLYFMNNCINHMGPEVNFIENLRLKISNLKQGAIFTIIDLDYENVRNTIRSLNNDCNDIVQVISTNINSKISVSKLNVKLPNEMSKYIFNNTKGLIAKKNTNYYYIILRRG